jgi:hypothetical protein
MKKLIIIGYFALSLVVTGTVVLGSQLVKMDKIEVKVRTIKTTLSDYEVEKLNKSGSYNKKFELKEGREFILAVDVKETRTKYFPIWHTKVDTLAEYILTEEDKRNSNN